MAPSENEFDTPALTETEGRAVCFAKQRQNEVSSGIKTLSRTRHGREGHRHPLFYRG